VVLFREEGRGEFSRSAQRMVGTTLEVARCTTRSARLVGATGEGAVVEVETRAVAERIGRALGKHAGSILRSLAGGGRHYSVDQDAQRPRPVASRARGE